MAVPGGPPSGAGKDGPEGPRRETPADPAEETTMRPAAISAAPTPGPDRTGPDVTAGGAPSGTAGAAGGITLGVEEEFVLLDPAAGAAVPAGPELVRVLGGGGGGG